ncbi:MAG: hypothetical protein P0Y52_07740 [Candidatus Brevundimonas phytovorans]|nr:hypothetical protein [Brevundimonas sp.]WEK59417.1 MAG: hypothetical protein P0Y52_07740 [Brevundimonas sp.]
MSSRFWPMWAALGFIFCAGAAARVLEAGVDWSGSTAADWFQAVGSVLAVAAAIFAAWTASRQSRLAANAEVVRTVELVCSIGYLMADISAAAFNELKEGSYVTPDNFEHVSRMYVAFPVDRYPSGEMALCLARIHRQTEQFKNAYFGTVAATEGHDPRTGDRQLDTRGFVDPLKLYKRVQAISDEYDRLVRIGQAILDQLPGPRTVIPSGNV